MVEFKDQKFKQIGGEPNREIKEIFVIVAESSEGEGIMGCELIIDGETVMTPLVGSDKERIKDFVKIANRISEETNTEFKVLKFTNKQDVTEEFV